MTNSLEGEALSKAVSEAYGIEPYIGLSNGPYASTTNLWLHEDSARCLDMAFIHDLVIDCADRNVRSSGNSYNDYFDANNLHCVRISILRCLLAMEGK